MIRVSVRLFVLGFLMLNLSYRVATIFDYSRVVSGVFVCLAVYSLVVIVFPRLLRGFLFLFGASFFLFGFRAYDLQSQVFEAVVVFVALTTFSVRRFRGLDEFDQDGQGVSNRQLMGLVGGYLGLSALSLMLLPMGHIVKDFWFFGWQTSFLQMANAAPNSWLYPLAGMNRLLLFLILALEVASTKEARELFRWIFIGIFVGGVFCAFIGLLDYYGVISLKWYRFNMTGTPGALHSTFLNRSWLAEFILMMAPFVLIGFMSKIKRLWWKFLLLASLVLCEIALLLGGARGGWVSYPLILFVCWLFFYFTKEGRLESFHFRWRDLVKVAVSVPITIVISLLLIFYVIMPLANLGKDEDSAKGSKAPPKHTTAYIERQAGRIVEPSGRLKAWAQGLDVGREKPWFGMGYEAFCWHANILSKLPDSYYVINKDNKYPRVLDTPHNIYFQLFVSGGIVGLCIWTLVIAYTLTILAVDLVRNKRLLNVPVIISIISFHTYGLFQSMQYIPMIWMFIFLALGYALTIDERVLPEKVRRATGWVIKGMVVLVLIGGVVYFVGWGSQDLARRYGLKAWAADQDWHNYLGFYPKEKWAEGFYRWSGKKGLLRVEGERGSVVGFDVKCSTPGVEEKPVVVTVSVDGESVDRLMFHRVETKEWRYWVTGEQGAGSTGQGAMGKGHEILIEVSRTWNPREMGISQDWRDLGVAVSEAMVREMPEEGVGFYHWETLDAASQGWIAQRAGSGARGARTKNGETEGLREDGKGDLRVRWTGKRASVPVEALRSEVSGQGAGSGEQGVGGKRVVFLRCGHPDIGQKRVIVKVFGDGTLLRHLVVGDHDWREVVFGGEELKGMAVVTFEVSRTWNPKRMGVSGDGRDLGMAVVVP